MKLIDVLHPHNRLTSMFILSSPRIKLTTDRSGDGGRAHDLSVEGKRHQAEQDRLDDQARDWIFNGIPPLPHRMNKS